jgi:hypothetical protein
MAKRFKNFREDAYNNEWGDKNEDRRSDVVDVMKKFSILKNLMINNS